MKGRVELVSPEGAVEGWCWNELSVDERTSLSIRVDGVEVGRTIACHYREDLYKAGIGDGHCSFRFLLPDFVLGCRRSQTITLVDATSGQLIGLPYDLKVQGARNFDDRVSELEARNRLLENRVEELSLFLRSDGVQAELFAIVGTFFQRLSHNIVKGISLTSELQFGDAIQAAMRTYRPLAFATTENPAISIVVKAAHPLNQLHTCLSATERASSRVAARVAVIDTGAFDETALLPSLVRGIRYIRTAGDLVTEWAEIDRGEIGPILLFLDGGAVVDDTFLHEIALWFDFHPETAAVGGCAVQKDGTVQYGGLRLADGRLVDCGKTGHDDAESEFTMAYPVHALSSKASAFRRSAIQSIGGLDHSFGDDIGAAVIDMCFRLREAGWALMCQPRATVTLSPPLSEAWITPSLSIPSRAQDLLSERWLTLPAASHPPLL